jgi:hypothetical protein
MKQIVAFLLFLLVFSSCKKSDNSDQSASGLDFTSVRRFDVGAVQGEDIGTPSDDYKMEDWPQWVYDFFTPLDTVNLTGYLQSPVSIAALYPNPCADTQNLRYYAQQPVNLKVVVIDAQKSVYLRKSIHLNSTQHDIGLNYSGLGMAANTNYRLFYAFSAENKPNFIRGHIDILKQQ